MMSWQFQTMNPVHPFRHSFIIKALLCYAFVQIILLLFINLPYTSDSLAYYEQASDCITHNTFYPAPHNLYDNFIVAPVHINFLSLILRIFHHPLAIRIANIVLNLLQVLLVYAITRLLFHNERQSKIAVLLYMAFLTNLGIIFYNYPELLFGVLLLLSFYLYLKDTPISTLISGIVLAFACNTRPIGLALFISILTIGIFIFIQEKHISLRILRVLGSCLFTLLVIGGITKLHMGYFVPLPTNGSYNILIGANDDATGAYNDRVFQPGKAGYFNNRDSLTFLEKEQFSREAAFKWIAQHPWRWLGLVPAKLFHLFGRDDWAIPALLNTDRWNIYTVAKLFIKEHRGQEIFSGENTAFIIAFITLFFLHHLYYYALIGMMAYQFWYYKKHYFSFAVTRNRPMYLFVLVGIMITLCSVGAPRYQYSFIIFLIPTITPMIDNILQKS
jgi:Predicted membrane protein (DUF2079).